MSSTSGPAPGKLPMLVDDVLLPALLHKDAA